MSRVEIADSRGELAALVEWARAGERTVDAALRAFASHVTLVA